MNLLKYVKLNMASTGQYENPVRKSRILDMQGFEGCLFLCIGTSDFCVDAASTGRLRLQGATGNSTAGMVTFSTAHCVAVSGTTPAALNNRIVAIDYYKPEKRYVRAKLLECSSGYVSIVGIQYGSRRPGSTEALNSTTVKASGVVVSPTT